MSRSFRLMDRVRSFGFAIAGVRTLLVSQHNAWIHAAITVGVISAGFFFGISLADWCCLIITMVTVWMAEALNTALEFLADACVPEKHPLIKKAKDVAAGAVLIAALGAVVIGVLIIGPHLLELFD